MMPALFESAVNTAAVKINWTEVATVVISGVGIVLGVLIVLILVFYAFGAFVSKSEAYARARKEKKAQKKAHGAGTQAAPAEMKAAAAPAPVAQTNSGAGDELIAVITAAVAAQEQSNHFVIKSIKKKNVRQRNAWAHAAVLDNTKSF